MLKTSPRSCSFTLSRMRMFLNNEKSKRLVGGPLIIPRPEFPTTFATPVPVVGLGCKHDVATVLAIHDSKVCGAFAFGSHNTFGRLPAIIAGMLPSPAASKFADAEKGSPLCRLTIPETCQPRMT